MSGPHGGLPAPLSKLGYDNDVGIGFPKLDRVPLFSREWWSYRVFWKIHFINRESISAIVLGGLGRLARRFGWIPEHRTLTKIDQSETARRWQEDDFFALQNVAHHNPEMIEACTSLDPDVGRHLVAAVPDLAERLAGGDVFRVDHGPTIGPHAGAVHEERSIDPSQAWYVRRLDPGRGHHRLVPIGIAAAGRLTLPDAGPDWQQAKWNHQQCNFLNSQIRYHLLLNHVVIEMFAIAMYRRLPQAHPLRFLLMPFVGSVPFVNNGFGKELIYGHLVRHYAMTQQAVLGFSQASLEGRAADYFDFRADLDRRGMRGRDFYTFGRVGEVWLDELDAGIDAILAAMYPTDDALAADDAARHWATEALGQLGWTDRLNTHDWDRAMLKHLLSGILMSSSYRHSIYHYKCHELFGVKENAPFHLTRGGGLPVMADQAARQMVGCGLEFPNVLYDLGSWSPGHARPLSPALFAAIEHLYVEFHRMTATLKAAEPDLASIRITTMSH